MIRRPKTIRSYDEEWDGLDHRSSRHDWDGVDRRSEIHQDWRGPERRHFADQQPIVIENVTHTSQPATYEVKASDSGVSKFFSNGAVISAVFSLAVAASGFIFDLYKRVTDLEYKNQAVIVKIEENKQYLDDIKTILKDRDKNIKDFESQLGDIERTLMEMYRQKK